MTPRAALFLMLILALLGSGRPAWGQDVIVQRAVLEAPRSTVALAQVRQGAFSETGRIISRGYTGEALWVRLRVHAPGAGHQLRLRVIPAQLEHVTVFSAEPGIPAQDLVGGVATLSGPDDTDYYLRIETSGPMLLVPTIASAAQAHQEDVTRGLVLGALLACYLMLSAWLLFLIAQRRRPIYAALLLNLTVAAATFLGWLGFLAEFFGPGHWAASTSAIYVLGLLNVFTGFLCVYLVLCLFGLVRWGHWLFGLLALLQAGLFPLFFMAEPGLVLPLESGLGLLASALSLVLVVTVFLRRRGAAGFVGLILLCSNALALRLFLTAYALVPPVDSLGRLFIFRIFFSIGFVSAIVWLIEREKRGELERARVGEWMARQLAEAEGRRRALQEQFMTMLVHELKTPLAIIQLATASLARNLVQDAKTAQRVRNIERAVDDLNSLVERCVAADQLDQEAVPVRKTALSLDALASHVLQNLNEARIVYAPPVPTRVQADEQHVRVILQNLLSNALKYSPAGSAVELRLAPSSLAGAPGVVVSVSNQAGAAGVPDADKVFSRYYRSAGARSQAGAGLGLWLCHTLAAQLGSELRFHHDHATIQFSFFLEGA